jgi:hypothetical protein
MHDTHGYRTQPEHVSVYVSSDFVAYCERKAQGTLFCSRISIWSAPLPLVNAVRLATEASVGEGGELAAYRKDLTARMVAATCVEAGLTSERVPVTAANARRELVRDIQAFLDATLDQSIGLEGLSIAAARVSRVASVANARHDGHRGRGSRRSRFTVVSRPLVPKVRRGSAAVLQGVIPNMRWGKGSDDRACASKSAERQILFKSVATPAGRMGFLSCES